MHTGAGGAEKPGVRQFIPDSDRGGTRDSGGGLSTSCSSGRVQVVTWCELASGYGRAGSLVLLIS